MLLKLSCSPRDGEMTRAAHVAAWRSWGPDQSGAVSVRARQLRRPQGGYILLMSRVELQTIHRFSQSQRRPLLGPTSAFTFKTLLRHYAKQALTHGK